MLRRRTPARWTGIMRSAAEAAKLPASQEPEAGLRPKFSGLKIRDAADFLCDFGIRRNEPIFVREVGGGVALPAFRFSELDVKTGLFEGLLSLGLQEGARARSAAGGPGSR